MWNKLTICLRAREIDVLLFSLGRALIKNSSYFYRISTNSVSSCMLCVKEKFPSMGEIEDWLIHQKDQITENVCHAKVVLYFKCTIKTATFVKQQDDQNPHVPKNYPLHLIRICVKHFSILIAFIKKVTTRKPAIHFHHHIWLIRMEFITFFIKHWITSTSAPASARQTKSLRMYVLFQLKVRCSKFVWLQLAWFFHYQYLVTLLLREKLEFIITYMYIVMLSRI